MPERHLKAAEGSEADEIPFNRPPLGGDEAEAAARTVFSTRVASCGPAGVRCERWLEDQTGAARVILTNSATSALEMSMLLAGIRDGDEVIMPSFSFPSPANAVALRGGVPVFVDVRPDTLNLDERLIEAAVTAKTAAILVVHYGGVASAMEEIQAIADTAGALVIEDAAHGLLASMGDRALGSLGTFGALSFHETKNVTSGEGGALLVNDERFVVRAEAVADNGTDRARFLRGEVGAYRWIDVGSSFRMSEISAAVLAEQLRRATEITERRLHVWNRYHAGFADSEKAGHVRLPQVPDGCRHNGHVYFLRTSAREIRDRLLSRLNEAGIQAVRHYEPLHLAPAAQKHAAVRHALPETEAAAEQILRLPLWPEMTDAMVDRVIAETVGALADR
jgi:dTDP-4-amino-4,6-dideoxygalactose transaminase